MFGGFQELPFGGSEAERFETFDGVIAVAIHVQLPLEIVIELAIARGGVTTNCGGVVTGTRWAAGYGGFVTSAAVVPVYQPIVAAPPPAPAPAPVDIPPPKPVYVAPVVAPLYVPPPVVDPMMAVGTIYTQLPKGAQEVGINNIQYYAVGDTFFRAYMGSNGVYYKIVPSPL